MPLSVHADFILTPTGARVIAKNSPQLFHYNNFLLSFIAI